MMSFKSCVHTICVWWLLSVGISIIFYLLHSLISRILEWANQQKRVEGVDQRYRPNLDDVIEGLKGTNGFIIPFQSITKGLLRFKPALTYFGRTLTIPSLSFQTFSLAQFSE